MKKRDYKSGGWLLHALLLYAAVMVSDDVEWMVLWYWGMGLFAAAAAGCLVLRGLGWRRGWKGPGLAAVWFAVWGGLGCYFSGAWVRGLLVWGGRQPHLALLLAAVLVLPAACRFRAWRSRPLALTAAVAAVVAGLAFQPPLEGPGEVETAGRLAALPYVGGGPVDAGRKAGVSVCRAERIQPGATLLILKPVPRPDQYPMGYVLVDSGGALLQAATFDRLHHFLLLKSPGEMMRAVCDPGLAETLEAAAKDEDVHHDVSLTADGRIRMLTQVFFRNLRASGLPVPMVAHSFQEFSPDGRKLRTVAFAPVSRPWMPKKRILRIMGTMFSRRLLWDLVTLRDKSSISQWFDDVFDLEHANALVDVPETIPGVCARGDVLVSLWQCGIAGILDPSCTRLAWVWKSAGPDGFHTPVWTGRGTVLLFENTVAGSGGTPHSRVVEVDLRSRQIVWSFAGQPPESPYSASQGACQLLPNGNVLVTWSTDCRVQEVTRRGEVVWDYRYASPGDFPPAEALYRAIRLCDEGQVAAVRAYLGGLAGVRFEAGSGVGGNGQGTRGTGPAQRDPA